MPQTDMQDTAHLPLKGIRVVSLEQAVAAPLCSRRLVLAGAEVIKIERPEGDFARFYDTAVAGESSYFVWLNAGKKSVVLDLKHAEDLTRLRRLVLASDVLIQNLKPGALQSLGLNLDTLHEEHPGLISVSISGFHPTGPGAARKAYDLLMQAESGLAAITGSVHEPGRVGVSVVDLSTGMFAYEAVLEALLRRAQTGHGESIDVALFDAVAEWMAVPYLLEQHTGEAPARVGLAHPGICPYGVFSSADEVRFVLSIQNEREWTRLCEVGLQQPELLNDPRCRDNETRVTHRDYVDGTLQHQFGLNSFAELSRRLDRADLAFAPVNPVSALATHSDLRTQVIRVGAQAVPLPVVPGRARVEGLAVPALGEHTADVLNWLDSLAPESN
ncbi:MAG: CaiB/BaiF CoA-transferase family protein [Pseudomonadota bacterium]